MIAALEEAVRKLAGETGSCSVSMQHVGGLTELWTVHAHAYDTSMRGQGDTLPAAMAALTVVGAPRRAAAA